MPSLFQMRFIASAERPDQRAQLPPKPEVALCGRSNVGKSSLLNALGGSSKLARVSKTPGRTRLINTFLVDDRFYFVDLPGYGYAKAGKQQQAQWGQTIPAYLADNTNLQLALVLVDFRIPPQKSDAELCAFLRAQGIRHGLVATKCDDVPVREWQKRIMDLAYACKLTFANEVLPVSAQKGTGLAELAQAILTVV